MINNLFLSVGAMKAGTTWLYEQLKDHPEIYFTPEKEIHYFANVIGIENQLNHKNRILKLREILKKYENGNAKFISEGIEELEWYLNYSRANTISNEWYMSLFSNASNSQYCCDFSNLYCQFGHEGWGNVRAVSSKLRVIYTLRDPFKRLWSHYKFHLKWIGRENDVLNYDFDAFKNLLEKSFFWSNAEYTKNYLQLREQLTEKELMLLYFEDFRVDPVKKLTDVTSFLEIQNISPDVKNVNKKVNSTKEFELPDEWQSYMLDKLRPEAELLKKEGLWHDSWIEI